MPSPSRDVNHEMRASDGGRALTKIPLMRTGNDAAGDELKGADGQHDAWNGTSASDRSAQLCRPRHRAGRHHPMGTGMSSKQKAVATRQLAAVAATAIALAVFDHDGLAGLSIDQLTTGSILERSPAGGILLAQLDEDRQPRGGGGVVAGLGVVEPESGAIDLSPGIPGVLSMVSVKEADRVQRGQLVASLKNDDLKARVAQAEATLRIRAAQRAMVEKGPRTEEVRQAEARLRLEVGNLALAEEQYRRRQALVGQGAVSREAFNEAETTLKAGRERRAEAEEALAILTEGSRPEEIEAARAEEALAISQLDEARAALDLSEVRATVDGVVLRVYREPGEAITAQIETPVLQIADTSRLVVRTQVDETQFSDVAVGQSATITAAALGGRTLSGKVLRISPRLGAKVITADDPAELRDTRVLDVIVSLPEGVVLPINLRVDVMIDIASTPRGDENENEVSEAMETAPTLETVAMFLRQTTQGEARPDLDPLLIGSVERAVSRDDHHAPHNHDQDRAEAEDDPYADLMRLLKR